MGTGANLEGFLEEVSHLKKMKAGGGGGLYQPRVLSKSNNSKSYPKVRGLT